MLSARVLLKLAPKFPDGPQDLTASSTSSEVLGKTLEPSQDPCSWTHVDSFQVWLFGDIFQIHCYASRSI